MEKKQAFYDLIEGVAKGRLTRRQMLQRAAALGLSGAALSSLNLVAASAQESTPEVTPISGGTLHGRISAGKRIEDQRIVPRNLAGRVLSVSHPQNG